MIKRFKVFTDLHLFSPLRIFLVYLFKRLNKVKFWERKFIVAMKDKANF